MILSATKINSKRGELWRKQVLAGNLLLKPSQRVAPLFGFGQRIIEEQNLLVFQAINDTSAKNQNYFGGESRLLYGLDDDHDLFVILPESIRLKKNCHTSSGFGDLIIQLESLIFQKYYPTHYYYMTLVANITIPTGSANKNPNTGFGSPSFFLGIPFRYVSINWYFYNAYGVVLTTSNMGTKFGNQFLYQAGLGRSLSHSKHWILTLTLEVTGIYSQKNKCNFVINQNSGGNVMWLGPNLWASNERIILHGGFQFAITQQLFGKQNKNIFRMAALFGYKFN